MILTKITSNIESAAPQEAWPRIERAEIMKDGQEIGILLREFDGTVSAVRINVSQLAD